MVYLVLFHSHGYINPNEIYAVSADTVPSQNEVRSLLGQEEATHETFIELQPLSNQLMSQHTFAEENIDQNLEENYILHEVGRVRSQGHTNITSNNRIISSSNNIGSGDKPEYMDKSNITSREE